MTENGKFTKAEGNINISIKKNLFSLLLFIKIYKKKTFEFVLVATLIMYVKPLTFTESP